MQKVVLVDSNKKKHKFNLGYSFTCLILGPIHLMFKGKVWLSLLLFLYYIILIPKNMFVNLISKIVTDASIIDILAYPHFSSDIFTSIVLAVLPQAIIAIFINNVRLKKAINKQNMLPASENDLETLTNYNKKYESLPIDSSYIQQINIKEANTSEKQVAKNKVLFDLDNDNLLNKKAREEKEKNDILKQRELDLIYNKYNMGLISEEELNALKRKIINTK